MEDYLLPDHFKQCGDNLPATQLVLCPSRHLRSHSHSDTATEMLVGCLESLESSQTSSTMDPTALEVH